MDTVGWSVLNDYNKLFDIQLGFFTFFLFAIFNFIILFRPIGLGFISDLKEQNFDSIIFLVSLVVVSSSVFPSIPSSFYLYIMFMLMVFLSNYTVTDRLISRRFKYLYAILIFCLISLVFFSRPVPVLTIFVLFFSVLVWFSTGLRGFAVFLLFILFRFDPISTFVVSDTFHVSEKFTSYLGIGSSAVWPNIGYIEQFPAKILYWLNHILPVSFNYHSFTQVLIFSLVSIMFSKLFVYRGLVVATLFLVLVPIDRFGPVSAIFLGYVVFYFLESRPFGFALSFAISPVLVLFFSPVDAVFFLLVQILVFPRLFSIDRFILVIAGLVGVSLIFVFSDRIFDYIRVYRSFSEFNMIAHGLPLFNLPFLDIFVKLALIGSIGLLFSYLIHYVWITDSEKHLILKIVPSFAIFGIFYIILSYALTRIDPGASRILNRCVFLLFITIIFIDVHKIVFIFVSIFSFFLQSSFFTTFSVAQLVNHFSFNSEMFVLSDDKLVLVESLKRFKNFCDCDVILYSDPALAYWLDFRLPPFTTPWVTVGNLAQDRNIEFFMNFPDSAIYLGDSWMTFDGVDIRQRAPRLFLFLENNYELVEFEGRLYYLPSVSIGSS